MVLGGSTAALEREKFAKFARQYPDLPIFLRSKPEIH